MKAATTTQTKKTWKEPRVKKLAAGSAEAGGGSLADGMFANS
ncbi:hypothetical protein [Sphingomonas parva]|nr:hypothetical protein [Sphingomonas parva]